MSTAAPARRATWHDAFDAQMALWRWTRPDAPGDRWIRAAGEASSSELLPETQQMQRGLYGHINRMLFDADPVFVSADMVDVVDAAMHSFVPEPLLPTDLITAHGFVYLEKPITIPDKWGGESVVTAISWCPLVGADPTAPQPDLHGDPLSYFKGRDYVNLWAATPDHDESFASQVDGVAFVLWQPAIPGTQAWGLGARHIPLHVTPWWFGMEFKGNEIDEHGDVTGAEWWWRMAQATFRLMMQQIAHRTEHRPDRATRRDAQRRGWRDREIVVVRLRREREDTLQTGPYADAHYSHRFIVGGHWRNQWYPASSAHRQIWISPHVKGPKDAPLLVKPRRVYTWNR